MILENIAQKIVESMSKIIDNPITIINEKGIIIGSSDQTRLGSFHGLSKKFIKNNQTISYKKEETQTLQNVLPGMILPIVFNNQKLGTLGIVGEPEDVKKYALLVKNHVEMLCNEVFKGEMFTLQSKTLDILIQYLLQYDEKDDTSHIIRYAEMLGYDFRLNRICLLIDVKLMSSVQEYKLQNFSSLQQEIQQIVKQLFAENHQDVVSLLTPEQFIVLKTISAQENVEVFIKKIEYKLKQLNSYLKNKHKFTAMIGVGSIQREISGVKESFQNATKALTAGKRSHFPTGVYHYNDWHITLEILSKELTPFMQQTLTTNIQSFIQHPNYHTLSATFLAYCRSNMNLSQTARNLYIHRNSLIYRLEKISELTSLDLSIFEQCLLLYMAIKSFETNSNCEHDSISL